MKNMAMQPTREQFAKFYKDTVGPWDSTRRNVNKWIDKGYKRLLEWQLPISMVALENHYPRWLYTHWDSVIPSWFNPNRTELEQKAIRVGYHDKKKANNYNGKGAWYLFPKVMPIHLMKGKNP